MISFMETQKATDLSVVACPLGISLPGAPALGTGMSGFGCLTSSARPASLATFAVRERSERPTQAPEVAAPAHAFAGAVANGAGSQQHTTQHMWAHRGFEPWRDPA